MSQYNFEGQPEGDWEDRGDLSWSEQDWQQFLGRRENEIVRFLKVYDACPQDELQRLDAVAREMGWDAEDWSVQDGSLDDDDEEEIEPDRDNDPYTLHRHPVFIAAIGLLTQVRHFWRQYVAEHKQTVDPLASWDFSDCLTEAERHALMAMQSMEVGDYRLCIIHFKRCLRGVNLAMGQLPALCPDAAIPSHLLDGIRTRLFDVREVALRVMEDCRISVRRGDFGDSE